MNKKLLAHLLRLVYIQLSASVMQFAIEWATTVGAASLAGLAVHIPGVLQTGSAAFAGFAALRYYLMPRKGAQGVSQAAREEDGGLDRMAAAMSVMAAARAAGEDGAGTGAYL